LGFFFAKQKQTKPKLNKYTTRAAACVEQEKELHSSQKDMKKGFGGANGLDDRVDKSALGYDADTKTITHASVTDGKKVSLFVVDFTI
jgi:hypothetical protein